MMLIKRHISKKALLVAAAGFIVAGGAWYLRPNPKLEQANAKRDVDLSTLVVPSAKATPQAVVQVQPVFVRYLSIDDAPKSEQAALKRQLKNLSKTGSLSGGALTVEFKQATHAKMTYRFGRKQGLSFEPAKISADGFILTGRQYEGTAGSNGFNGLYRLFENPSNKARLEMVEAKISADKPVTLFREFITKHIQQTPIIYETLTDKKGVAYHNARFVHHDKLYTISTKGMSEQEVDNFITMIINQ